MSLSSDVFLAIFLGIVLFMAAFNDIRYQKIPNRLTYPSMAVAVGYHCMISGLDGLLFSVGGLAVGIGIFLVAYMMGSMGAGDAKLMGAVGAIIGSKGVIIAIVFTAIIGGVYALIVLLFNRQYLKKYITNLKAFLFTGQFNAIQGLSGEGKPKLCYGVAIAVGTFIYVLLELSGHTSNFLNHI